MDGPCNVSCTSHRKGMCSSHLQDTVAAAEKEDDIRSQEAKTNNDLRGKGGGDGEVRGAHWGEDERGGAKERKENAREREREPQEM